MRAVLRVQRYALRTNVGVFVELLTA